MNGNGLSVPDTMSRNIFFPFDKNLAKTKVKKAKFGTMIAACLGSIFLPFQIFTR